MTVSPATPPVDVVLAASRNRVGPGHERRVDRGRRAPRSLGCRRRSGSSRPRSGCASQARRPSGSPTWRCPSDAPRRAIWSPRVGVDGVRREPVQRARRAEGDAAAVFERDVVALDGLRRRGRRPRSTRTPTPVFDEILLFLTVAPTLAVVAVEVDARAAVARDGRAVEGALDRPRDERRAEHLDAVPRVAADREGGERRRRAGRARAAVEVDGDAVARVPADRGAAHVDGRARSSCRRRSRRRGRCP